MFLRRCDRLPALAVGIALVTGACAQVGDPGVAVQNLQAEIAFGVDIPEEDGPAPSPTQAGDDVAFDDGSLQVPFRNRIPDRFRDIEFTVPPPEVVECPSAGIGASPATLASEEVGDDPEEGIYRWKRELLLSRTVNGIPIEIRTEGFENRIVRNVVEVTAAVQDPTDETPGRVFDYEVVRPDGTGQVISETYRVNTSPIVRGANVSQNPRGVTYTVENALEDEGVPADLPDDAQEALPQEYRPRVGEPNRGLTLTNRSFFDGNGAEVGTFRPVPEVLLLPFPVDAGDLWTSTSLSNRGQVYRVQGTVSRRQSVDACGTMLDGWLAELDVVDASADSTVQRTEDLVVSTEMGGLIIAQTIVEEGVDEAGNLVRFEAKYSLASTTPEPLPEDAS